MTRTTVLIESVIVPARSMLGAELTEGEAAFRVFVAAGGLILLGIGLLAMTVWWWRSTRPEPPALAPLEVMSDRKWMTAGESERRRIVEDFRPDGAVPMRDVVIAPVPVDLAGLARDVPSFDDLRDVSLDSERPPSVDPERLELAPSPSVSWSPSASIAWPPADAGALAAGESGDSGGAGDAGNADVTTVDTDGRQESLASPVEDEPEREPTAAETKPAAEVHQPIGEPADEPIEEPAEDGADVEPAEDGAYDATAAQVRPSNLSEAVGRD